MTVIHTFSHLYSPTETPLITCWYMRSVLTASMLELCHGVKNSFRKYNLHVELLSRMPICRVCCSHSDTASIMRCIPCPRQEIYFKIIFEICLRYENNHKISTHIIYNGIRTLKCFLNVIYALSCKSTRKRITINYTETSKLVDNMCTLFSLFGNTIDNEMLVRFKNLRFNVIYL